MALTGIKNAPHLVVIGDELESCLFAVAASLEGWRVTLARRSDGWLGGVSTRGGLGYMDLTPGLVPPLMLRFLEEAGLKRVALCPQKADAVLRSWLAANAIHLISGAKEYSPVWDAHKKLLGVQIAPEQAPLEADFYVDATPDATLARACGVPYLEGLGGVLGHTGPLNFLGVSPVFTIKGLSRTDLRKAEAQLRQRNDAANLLEATFPFYSAAYRQALLERPTYAPDALDYIDVLNPTLGAYYHKWRYGRSLPYQEAPFWIDGGNIACLSQADASETLVFNGLLASCPNLEKQLAYSEETEPYPQAFNDELQAVEAFLKEITGQQAIKVEAPPSLYVRQTVLLQARCNLSGTDLLTGGVSVKESIGQFSYWLDFRGLHPWVGYPDLHPLPKPVFASSLQTCFPKEQKRLHNLAFLGRSAGFSPLSQGACRIVQHSCLLAEALAVALGIAKQGKKHPAQVEPERIRVVLEERAKTQQQPEALIMPLSWSQGPDPDIYTESWLLRADTAITAALQELSPFSKLEATAYKAPYAENFHQKWVLC